jgi:zinc protease
VESLLLKEIDAIKTEGVTESEVKTALTKLRVYKAYNRDGTAGVASNLNECIAAGDWTLFYTLDKALGKVTAADVQRVAVTYLGDEQRTTGWFIPVTKSK